MVVLAAGNFYIEDQIVKVASLGEEEFVARIHSCPFFVPQEVLSEVLGRYAEVRAIKFETPQATSPWLDSITLVRTVVLCGEKEDVPHILTVPNGKYVIDMLVTITGRVPVCLKCRQRGHMRKKCTASQCRHCKLFGHETEDCPRPMTAPAYSSVVKGPERDFEDKDDPMEDPVLVETAEKPGEATASRGKLAEVVTDKEKEGSVASLDPPVVSEEAAPKEPVEAVVRDGAQPSVMVEGGKVASVAVESVKVPPVPVGRPLDLSVDAGVSSLPESQELVVIPCAQPPSKRLVEDMEEESFKEVVAKRKGFGRSSPPTVKHLAKEFTGVSTHSRFKDLDGVDEMGISDSASEPFSPGGDGRESWDGL